jgi:site-specific DNA recombinase
MFYTFQAAQAQWEREEIADRQKASILVRAKLGKTINGMAPYGYQWKDRKLVIQPDEAPVVRKAYELFLQYRRKGTVAKLLNAAGHRARKGALWSDTQVKRVLAESAIKGIYYFNRIRKNGHWKGTEKPEEEWGKVECEAIVSPELWNQVNVITEEQLKLWKKPGKVPVHIFGNLTWCQCGGKMYARSDSPKYHCRKCNRKIPMTDLEAIFREELHAFFGSSAKIAAHMTEAKRNVAEKEQALAAQERQIQKIRDEMKQTHQLYLEGHVTPQGFGQFYKPAEERLNQLLGELPKLEAEVAYLKVNDVSGEEVLHEARTLYDQWPKLTNDEKRKIAEAIMEKIVVGDGEIDLTLSFLPTSEELCKSQQRMAPATG